jgi:hypothetical protein
MQVALGNIEVSPIPSKGKPQDPVEAYGQYYRHLTSRFPDKPTEEGEPFLYNIIFRD